MKILPYADLHIEFESGVWTPPSVEQTDVVVLAGDTYTKGRGPEFASQLFPDKQIIMVAGNHEYYGQGYPKHLEELKAEAATIDNLHFLENQAVEIGGVVFLGCALWTDCKLFEGLYSFDQTVSAVYLSLNDYRQIHYYKNRDKREIVPQDFIDVHHKSVSWLKDQFELYKGRKIVVVTHHGPSMLSVPEQFKKNIISAAFVSNLDDLVEGSGAALWVHGHSHGFCDYQIGNTRVVCNPKGYPHETTGFQPSVLIEL